MMTMSTLETETSSAPPRRKQIDWAPVLMGGVFALALACALVYIVVSTFRNNQSRWDKQPIWSYSTTRNSDSWTSIKSIEEWPVFLKSPVYLKCKFPLTVDIPQMNVSNKHPKVQQFDGNEVMKMEGGGVYTFTLSDHQLLGFPATKPSQTTWSIEIDTYQKNK